MTQELALLPAPQRLAALAGRCSLEDERFILLTGAAPGALLRTGERVQEALALVGPRWALTAARGADPQRIGAVIDIDPAQMPRREGYTLTILPDQIRIVAHDAAGAFYAAATLHQIARQHIFAGQLPCLRIEDWPDYAYRGVMLDISRDKVPTLDTLYMLVDMLAAWKVNQFQLYTEHTFAYRNHRVVWEHASPITGEEIMALDTYCRERYIELVPNQNSFGHMARWLKHPAYRHLAEAPDGFDTPWGFRFEGPFSLNPLDPGSIMLVAELFDELLPHFSSRQFNVGCDETWDVGQGKSKAACEARGKGRVYLEFLLKIHKLVQERGLTMQFWGDIINQHPELIAELPDGIVALEWGYEADHPFAENGAKFARSGVPFYVCPGTSSWNNIAGRTDNAIGNLWNAAANGLAHGAIGYLNTDWGDNGHWQHFPISFLGFAYGAAVSWAGPANKDLDLPRALDLHAFQDDAGVMGRLAYDLGNAYQVPGAAFHNSSALFHLLHYLDRTPGEMGLSIEALKRTQAYIEHTLSPLPKARMARPDADLIVEEFYNAAALLDHACKLGIARLETSSGRIADIPAATRQALAGELEAIIAAYRQRWLSRNRAGGLKDSIAQFEKLLSLYRAD